MSVIDDRINTKHMRNNMYCDCNIYCTNIARCSNIKYFLPRERFWICVRIGSNPIIVKTRLTLYNMIDITAIFLHKWNSVFVFQYFPQKKKNKYHFPLLSLSPFYLFIKSIGRLLILFFYIVYFFVLILHIIRPPINTMHTVVVLTSFLFWLTYTSSIILCIEYNIKHIKSSTLNTIDTHIIHTNPTQNIC